MSIFKWFLKEDKPLKPKKEKPQVTNKPEGKFYLPYIAFYCIPIFSPLAFVLGLIALDKIKKNPNLKGKTFALLAVIIPIALIGIIILSALIAFGILNPPK